MNRRYAVIFERAEVNWAAYVPDLPGCVTADSEGCRSAFRTDVDHDSEVMPISVPN